MSEIFDIRHPYPMTQQSKWYHLQGPSLDAWNRLLELDKKQATPDTAEKQRLAKALGLLNPVDRTDVIRGYAGISPEIFEDPYSEAAEFYMLCPIGLRDGVVT